MAELQSVIEGNQTNGAYIPLSITSSEPPEPSAGSKRLRRPSVRLGNIGGVDQYQQHIAYDPTIRRPKWRPASNNNNNNKIANAKPGSRTRTLTNLGSSGGGFESSGGLEEDPNSIGSWRVNKWSKRVWEEEEEEGEDFSREDSESPVEENRRRGSREVEVLSGRGGVKVWLQELGLGRYWPMFEMHEVDEQVLGLLTLEDLKDMGINAVGSRRKMFCAIQKLGRDFS